MAYHKTLVTPIVSTQYVETTTEAFNIIEIVFTFSTKK